MVGLLNKAGRQRMIGQRVIKSYVLLASGAQTAQDEQGCNRDGATTHALTTSEREWQPSRTLALTPREREVLEHGISPRTGEVHKTRIMETLGVRNVAELVRFALAATPSRDSEQVSRLSGLLIATAQARAIPRVTLGQ